MRIGIVTIYDGNNFGSFFQAYALMKEFESMGHEVFFVERMKEEDVLSFYLNLRVSKDRGRILNCFADLKRSFFNRSEDLMRKNDITSIYPYLKEARKVFKIINVQQIDELDILVFGSDEIWNFRNAAVDVSFYSGIDFRFKKRKIAYAISTGTSTVSDFEKCKDVFNQIKEFDLVIARDKATETVLEAVTGKKIEITCDPTLLLDKSEYIKNRRRIIREKYMLIYAYSMSRKQEQIIRDYADSHGLKIVSTCNYLRVSDDVVQVDPFDFPNLIMDAECCFTSTFHGTIFVSLFAKRFCIYPRRPKVKDVAEVIGIDDYIWDGNSTDDFLSIIEREVDNKKISNRIANISQRGKRIISDLILS